MQINIAANGQGFLLCQYSPNVQPGTVADEKYVRFIG